MPLSFPNSPTNGQIVTISGRQWTFTTGRGWAASGGMAAQGLATTDAPQFAGLNLGNASDTTLSRLVGGAVAVEGKAMPYIFAQTATAVSVGAVTSEAVLATVTIPGGVMGPNGILIIDSFWSYNNNANNKSQIIRVGGPAGTQVVVMGSVSMSSVIRRAFMINNNSQSAQKFLLPAGRVDGFGQASAAPATSAVNTASNWDLVFSGQKAVSGDTLTLEGYQISICYGA